MTRTTTATVRRPRPARDPFAHIVTVSHDVRESTVMYPVPAVATVTDEDLWTPSRLRA